MLRILLSSAILIGIAALYFCHVRLKPADLPFYRKLVRESIDLHAHSALEKSPVRQMRKGVRKDIWTIKDGARVHDRIVCAESDMTLTQKKEKIEAIEILHEIVAWVNVGEEVRHLTAESGTYHFPSCEIDAQHLAIDSQQIKCVAQRSLLTKDTVQLLGAFHMEHPAGRIFGEKGILTSQGASNHLQFEEGVLFEAVQAPFSISSMRAEAIIPQKATLAELASEEIRFSGGVEIQSVSGIRATGDSAIFHQNSLRLFPEPGSRCTIYHGSDWIEANEIQFDKTTNELLCISPHGRFEESNTLFDADTGRAQFLEGFQPQTLLLEGNVRIASHLQKKESFAMADSAVFHVDQKKIVLQSTPLSRVLFRQEGLEISAPLVHIQEAIQGFGDVRFFFYPQENDALETIFMRYL